MYQCVFCKAGFIIGWFLEIVQGNKLTVVYCCQKCKEANDGKEADLRQVRQA